MQTPGQYYVSVNLNISSVDGSQGNLNTSFNKRVKVSSLQDLITLLQAFDKNTDNLRELLNILPEE